MVQWKDWLMPATALGAAVTLILLAAYAIAPGPAAPRSSGLADLPGFQVLTLS